MARSEVITTCDCGCGKQAKPYELERWLMLTQHPEHSRTAEPKLGRESHWDDDDAMNFATFDCLLQWTKRAVAIIPKMSESASGLHPRGGYYSEEFPYLWF